MSTSFERYVNSKDNQTAQASVAEQALFERYVNSKDNQTEYGIDIDTDTFERYVNSKDNQTGSKNLSRKWGLRDM